MAVSGHDLDLPVSDWVIAARASVAAVAATEGRTCTSPGTQFPTPQNSSGKTMRELLKAQAGAVGLRHSSVHKAKGTEDRGLFRLSCHGTTHRRLTQPTSPPPGRQPEHPRQNVCSTSQSHTPEELCAIAVPDGIADRIVAILNAEGVPFTIDPV